MDRAFEQDARLYRTALAEGVNSASTVVVCADDFGLAPALSDAIVSLLAAQRLSATSCMVDGAAWRSHAPALRALAGQADVGLHLTLTDQLTPATEALAPGGRFPPLSRLLPRALARRLPVDVVRGEIRRQLDVFEDVWGAPPDFVDGHQHAHILPGVREALVAELCHRYPLGRVYVRDCSEALGTCRARGAGWPKAVFISTLAAGLSRALRANGLPCNAGFSGLHDFSADPPFRTRMQAFLRVRGPRHLLHVHPGKVDAVLQAVDGLTTPREWELSYLSSDAYIEDLAVAGARPARFAAFADAG